VQPAGPAPMMAILKVGVGVVILDMIDEDVVHEG